MSGLIILHVLICLFLVAVILLQPGKGDAGIGFGSSSQSIFGSKGAGNFLTRTTTVVAVLYLGTSFVLTRNRMKESTQSVISDSEKREETPAAPPAEAAKPVEKPATEAKKK